MIASKAGRSDQPGRQTYCALQGRTQGERSRKPDSFTASGRSCLPASPKLALGLPPRERSSGRLVSTCSRCGNWIGTGEPALQRCAASAILTGPGWIEALSLHPAEALVLGDGGDLDSTTNRLRQEDGEADEPDGGLDQEACEVD